MSAHKYQLIDYFDVWGNEKDGYEVNNMCVEEENIWLDDDITPKEILEWLRKNQFLTTSDLRVLAVEDLGEIIEIYQRKGMYPLYSLRRVIK